MIRKSRKRQQTKDRKINYKRGGPPGASTPSLVLDLSFVWFLFLDFLIVLFDFLDISIDVHDLGDVLEAHKIPKQVPNTVSFREF